MFEEDEQTILFIMNGFLGNKYNKDEINEILLNKKIKKDNEKYIGMLKAVQYAFPYKYVNSDTVPTLCIYGGLDTLVGVAQYSSLKKLAEKYGNKIELVYMKNGGHLLDDYKTTDGVKSMREMNFQILSFAKTYFTFDKKN
jgi:pimeloyl-ACP methyl ester carboxylesterase